MTTLEERLAALEAEAQRRRSDIRDLKTVVNAERFRAIEDSKLDLDLERRRADALVAAQAATIRRERERQQDRVHAWVKAIAMILITAAITGLATWIGLR